jgi:hypothetical protein
MVLPDIFKQNCDIHHIIISSDNNSEGVEMINVPPFLHEELLTDLVNQFTNLKTL